MTTKLPDPKRKPLPRWRLFSKTLQIGELGSSLHPDKVQKNDVEDNYIQSQIDKWKLDKTLAVATDILGVAILSKSSVNLQELADFIVADNNAPSTSSQIARNILNGVIDPLQKAVSNDNSSSHFESVRFLKNKIKNEPRNSIAYVDLALHYTILSEYPKAEKALKIALNLASDNRFVLRSASRFFIHIGEENTAHKILRRSGIGDYDPWIAAAEIAVANFANNPSRFAKKGISQLENKKYSFKHLSELASALATLEMTNGKYKQSNKFFKQSLLAPNDNALAQAEWAIRHGLKNLHIDSHVSETIPCSFEARTWEFYLQEEWQATLEQADLWFRDESFSTLPAIFCAHIHSVVMGNYDKSIEYLEIARKLKPEYILILNNLAFVLATKNKVKEAEQVINEINWTTASELEKIFLTATVGLIEFRKGNILQGKLKYLEAIQLSKNQDPLTQLSANVYFTRELLIANLPGAFKMGMIVKEQMEKVYAPETKILFKREIEPLLERNSLK